MRILLGVFAVAALATSAFAVGELRALRHHGEAVAQAEVAPVVGPDDPAPGERAPLPPAQLSTWRGATPFGGVPGAAVEDDDEDEIDEDDDEDEIDEESDESHEVVIDQTDRCPEVVNGLDDIDGCPDVDQPVAFGNINPTVRRVIVLIDGVEREVQVQSRITIRLNDDRNIIIY
jgi:hypothetical protein